MAPTDPVPWEPLAELGAHTCLQCEAVFEHRRSDLDADMSRETVVARLYEWWHEAMGDETGNEPGAVYVFAYLLERDGLVSPEAGTPTRRTDGTWSVVDRRPDDATLERWFWHDEQVPWWIAVRCGVHYSLIQYWLSEADIPLMRRNVPDALLERVDAMSGDAP